MPADQADHRGRVRLVCRNCGARVLVKVNPRALKLDPAIPSSRSVQRASSPGTPLPIQSSGVWAVVVNNLPQGAEDEARAALLTLPRFRANPNKLHDLTLELPYVLHGLTGKECRHLEHALSNLAVQMESGPQEWLLDERLIPLAPDLRGPRPRVQPDGDYEPFEDVNSGSWEIDFLGGRKSRSKLEAISAVGAAAAVPAEDTPSFSDMSFAPEDRSDPWGDAANATPDEPEELQEVEPEPADASAGSQDGFADFYAPASEDFDERSGVELEIEGTTLDGIPAVPEDISSELHLRPRPVDEPSGAPYLGPALDHNATADFAALDPSAEFEVAPSEAADPDTAFAIVTVDELPGRTFHIGTLHTSIALSSAELDVGTQMAVEIALEQAHAVLQDRASDLGATGIVGLRVNQTAIPSKAGWMLVLVVSGTAVA